MKPRGGGAIRIVSTPHTCIHSGDGEGGTTGISSSVMPLHPETYQRTQSRKDGCIEEVPPAKEEDEEYQNLCESSHLQYSEERSLAWLRNEVPPMASDWKKAWAICAPTKNKMAQIAICGRPKRPYPDDLA